MPDLGSSFAAVYGNPYAVPIWEDFPSSVTNSYGQTKLMSEQSEQILRDLEKSDHRWRIGYLRYFNPVGAHESGLIVEDPDGVPNNLMPYVAQGAIGNPEKLCVYGEDYRTKGEIGVCDSIRVMELAQGTVVAC